MLRTNYRAMALELYITGRYGSSRVVSADLARGFSKEHRNLASCTIIRMRTFLRIMRGFSICISFASFFSKKNMYNYSNHNHSVETVLPSCPEEPHLISLPPSLPSRNHPHILFRPRSIIRLFRSLFLQLFNILIPVLHLASISLDLFPHVRTHKEKPWLGVKSRCERIQRE